MSQAPERGLREEQHVSRLRPSGALRLQSDHYVETRCKHQNPAELRTFSRRAHRRSRQSFATTELRLAVLDAIQSSLAVRARRRCHAYFGSPDLNVAPANVDTVMAFVEHDFGGGL